MNRFLLCVVLFAVILILYAIYRKITNHKKLECPNCHTKNIRPICKANSFACDNCNIQFTHQENSDNLNRIIKPICPSCSRNYNILSYDIDGTLFLCKSCGASIHWCYENNSFKTSCAFDKK